MLSPVAATSSPQPMEHNWNFLVVSLALCCIKQQERKCCYFTLDGMFLHHPTLAHPHAFCWLPLGQMFSIIHSRAWVGRGIRGLHVFLCDTIQDHRPQAPFSNNLVRSIENPRNWLAGSIGNPAFDWLVQLEIPAFDWLVSLEIPRIWFIGSFTIFYSRIGRNMSVLLCS